MVALGALCERLLVQQDTTSTDTSGGRSSSWGTLDTLFAERIPLSAGETLEAERLGSQVQYRFRVHARADVTAKMRALWTPAWPRSAARQVLQIHAVVPDASDRGFMVLECGAHDGGD